MIMLFNLRHFGAYSMKKSFLDYERFNAQRAKFNHQISLHTPVCILDMSQFEKSLTIQKRALGGL